MINKWLNCSLQSFYSKKSFFFFHKIKEFDSEWQVYLKQIKINEAEVKLANEALKDLESRLSTQIAELNQTIFNHKQIKFIPNEIKLQEPLIGEIQTEKSYKSVALHANLEGHDNCVNVLILLANGDIVSGSYDNTVRVWNHETGELLKILTGHTSYVLSLVLLNNEMIASGSIDGTIIIWDTLEGSMNISGDVNEEPYVLCIG
jgi:WD40 repeat protein